MEKADSASASLYRILLQQLMLLNTRLEGTRSKLLEGVSPPRVFCGLSRCCVSRVAGLWESRTDIIFYRFSRPCVSGMVLSEKQKMRLFVQGRQGENRRVAARAELYSRTRGESA